MRQGNSNQILEYSYLESPEIFKEKGENLIDARGLQVSPFHSQSN